MKIKNVALPDTFIVIIKVCAIIVEDMIQINYLKLDALRANLLKILLFFRKKKYLSFLVKRLLSATTVNNLVS